MSLDVTETTIPVHRIQRTQGAVTTDCFISENTESGGLLARIALTKLMQFSVNIAWSEAKNIAERAAAAEEAAQKAKATLDAAMEASAAALVPVPRA